MKKFAYILRDLSEKLELPQPVKSRILLEVSADIEDFYYIQLDDGCTEDEAITKVEEKFIFTDESLSNLKEIHKTFYDRIVNKFSEHARNRWERMLLILTLLFITAYSGKQMLTMEFLRNASKFIWPVYGFGLIIVTIGLMKVYSLYIKKDHSINKLRSGLPELLLCGGFSIITGITGYFVELYQAGYYGILLDIDLFFVIPVFSSDSPLLVMVESMISTSAMIMASLTVGLLTGLIWYILTNKVLKVEQAEAILLLE